MEGQGCEVKIFMRKHSVFLCAAWEIVKQEMKTPGPHSENNTITNT